jgi:hypothetical protein
MYRPVQQQGTSVKTVFFSDNNFNTLKTVLIQDFQERNNVSLSDQQQDRLSKTLNHYINQVYQVQGEKPVQTLNKEVLTASAKDFSQYLQRKELTKNTSSVKTVMNDSLFQETSQRFEQLSHERNEVKALPPPPPDFRIDFKEDGPPAADLFERAKKQREIEALRSAQQNAEMLKAEAGIQGRVTADSMFRTQHDAQNRNNELALVQRQQNMSRPTSTQDLSLAVMPDRRELLLAPIGSFDTMTSSPPPRELGQANSNPTIINPQLASPTKNDLPQNYVQREDSLVSYRETENNLFIYSADRDWLRNNKENRYSFTVNFDPAANGQGFNPTLSAQQKFKNIVRIELVKCIMAGEGLDVSIRKTTNGATAYTTTTDYQDNILNLPYITVRVAELENNNYGTDNFLDRSFGVLQYDAQWLSDTTYQAACTRGFLAMIPKFLKCQKDFYPTPLSTLQKMTIDIRRPNGELLSNSPDTYDIAGIIGAQDSSSTPGPTYPFSVNPAGSSFNVFNPASPIAQPNPGNFFIITNKYFSRFDVCKGDRIQMSGYTYNDGALNDATYGGALRDFSNWINRQEGHIVLGIGYTNTNTGLVDEANNSGYANVIIIQTRYQDPTTGSTLISPFGNMPNFSSILNSFGVALQSPRRLINLNRQLNLVFRVITREMDSLPQIRPDNNY